jgi:hypothetical protein
VSTAESGTFKKMITMEEMAGQRRGRSAVKSRCKHDEGEHACDEYEAGDANRVAEVENELDEHGETQ